MREGPGDMYDRPGHAFGVTAARGTILLEMPVQGAGRSPTLLRAVAGGDRIDLVAGAQRLSLSIRIHGDRFGVAIPFDIDGVRDGFSCAITWDASAARGVLAAWSANTSFSASDFVMPAGLPVRLCRSAVEAAPLADGDSCAFASEPVMLGYLPGFSRDAVITTPGGPRRLRDMRSGDMVSTACGSTARVVWAGSMVVPGVGLGRPWHLRAPYFGLDQDLHIAERQDLRLSGDDVTYVFGTDEVRAPIPAFSGRMSVRRGDAVPEMVYAGVILDWPAGIMLNGVAVATPDIAALKRSHRPDLSILSACDFGPPADRAASTSPRISAQELDALLRLRQV